MTYYDSHSCGQYKLIEDIIMKRSIVIRKILRIFCIRIFKIRTKSSHFQWGRHRISLLGINKHWK